MKKHEYLIKAKKAKQDEFYTQYSDIENECKHYKEHFKNKVIYCNCDDPAYSNFWKFFHNNFKSLGLKKLIATHYAEGEQDSYAMIYEGGNDFDIELGQSIPIHSDDGFPEKGYCAGDFRSRDCISFLEESDIVCTNPPFSLFREYVAQLVEHKKNFIIIGNQNAITYKEVFPYIKNNELWLGYRFNKRVNGKNMTFRVPDDYPLSGTEVFQDENNNKYVSVAGTGWFTNLDIKKRHDGLWHLDGKFDQTKAHSYYEGFKHLYPKYDNYDAINVDKTKEIPIDYSGVMGVPITWLDKYNPDEFEMIGLSASWDETEEMKRLKTSSTKRHNPIIQGKAKYARIFIKNKNPISKADDESH